MKSRFDRYTVQARIQPALVTALPLGLLVLAWASNGATATGILWAVVVTGGGTGFLAQIARDLGRRKQAGLYREWGGPPTTQKLRFQGNANRELLNRRRQKLETVANQTLPTGEEETGDPVVADQRYESAVAYLLEATRDHEKFPLVLEENINYGFRRNLWGMKPYGVGIASLATLAAWGLFLSDLLVSGGELVWYERLFVDPEPDLTVRLIGSMLNMSMLVGWIFVIRPEWVKTTADAYAERLIAAVDAL